VTRLLGQFDTANTALLRTVAGKLRRASNPGSGAGVIPSIRQATVVSVEAGSPPTLTVTFDGDIPLPLVRYLASYTPAAGQVVEVLVRSGNPFVLGTLAA